ncbi:unnamed protein product [Staurois parvus]|uniref:Vitelline membrane outer layer protein 1 homolog n=1 Tax=Staurois parvus TaxID=386267 RepID=A0ABN9GA23_9NEOB|nr:unnamed protein product [Staurois parvus]
MIYIFVFHYRWGTWTTIKWCPSGRIIQFALQVEQPLPGNGDDTAANNIRFRCSDNTVLIGIGGPWGTWGLWSAICVNGIVGIKTRVEPPQGPGDDTSLNNVIFLCL